MRALAFLIVILSFSAAVQAQTGLSSVRGLVTDPQGQAVAGATVNLTNTERNFTRTQTTNEEGAYIFSAVPPGTYRLEAEPRALRKQLPR